MSTAKLIHWAICTSSSHKKRIAQGDEIEIRPGHVYIENNQQVWKALTTKITGLMTGNNQIKEVGPGGSIAIMTKLDPTIVKSDQLTGSIVGKLGKLPDVYNTLKLEIHLLKRVVGTKKEIKVDNIKMQETIMLNVNSAATVGIVIDIGKNTATSRLKLPICAEKGSRVTISRLIENRFRLIGYGVIQ